MEVTLEGLLAAIAVVVTIAIYVITRMQERKLRQAELVRNYTNDFYANDEVLALFMDIDHRRFKFEEDFLGSERELHLIHLLDFLNMVGHNWRRGVINIKDIFPTTIGYTTLRTWDDPTVQKYLRIIEKWDEERYYPGSGFAYFKLLAQELERTCGRIAVPRGKNNVSSSQHIVAVDDQRP